MELIKTPVGTVICEAGEAPKHVYFPASGVISALVILEEGATVEALTIGNEGLAGVFAAVKGSVSQYRMVQRIADESYRIPAAAFEKAVREIGSLRWLLERYLLTLLQSAAQNAACHSHHTVEERLCRWLLETSDRLGNDDFEITQELLGEMLGVRRQSVNLVARRLQQAGHIDYQRGRLAILDRTALEHAACECHRVTREMYARLMGFAQHATSGNPPRPQKPT
jgi:CRP-like cAMP-binding protein